MNVGISTLHQVINHGAFLQAYALQRSIERLGHSATVIHYRDAALLRKEYRLFLPVTAPQQAWRNWKKIRLFKRALRDMHHTKFSFTFLNIAQGFDAIVYGSDEIWNYKNVHVGLDMAYFGGGTTSKRIAYAPSFNTVPADDAMPTEVVEALNAFSSIGVRDPHSAKLVERATGKIPEVVLDPTLIYDFTKDIPNIALPDDMLVVYAHPIDKVTQQEIQAYAKAHNLRTVAIGYHQAWADESIVAIGPWEWLAYMKAAKKIFTNTFHGALFSIHFHVPFALQMREDRLNKLGFLLEELQLTNRRIAEDNTISSVLDQSIDYNAVEQVLQQRKQESLAYLQNALTV